MTAWRFTERELRVPADFALLPQARDFAEEAAAAVGFEQADRHAIRIAFGEAVANAIEHGSQPGGPIDLRAALEGDSLALYIRDRGTFVPRVDPRGELPERGRGLAFMSELVDEVELQPSPEGTLVRLAKRLPADP